MKWLRHIPALILLIVGAVLLNYYLPDRRDRGKTD
jgi:hypothetical protein